MVRSYYCRCQGTVGDFSTSYRLPVSSGAALGPISRKGRLTPGCTSDNGQQRGAGRLRCDAQAAPETRGARAASFPQPGHQDKVAVANTRADGGGGDGL